MRPIFTNAFFLKFDEFFEVDEADERISKFLEKEEERTTIEQERGTIIAGCKTVEDRLTSLTIF